MHRLLVCLVAAPLGSGAQAVGQTPEQTLVSADRAGSDSSGRSGLGRAILDLAAPDIVYLHPGAPVVVGRDRVEALLRAQTVLASLEVRWTPLHAEVSRDAGFGVSYGLTVITDGTEVWFGKYLSAWRREGERWMLVAHAQVGLVRGEEAAKPERSGTGRLSPLPSTGLEAPFILADRAFAVLAGKQGAPAAFEAFAARDAVTFSAGTELRIGPAAIRRAMEQGGAGRATWWWEPLAAGAARSGDLGFTVGEAVIRPPAENGPPIHSKYLTLWRKDPAGLVRFIADAGSTRPPSAR
jgi:ketosteroid isomerase-like protein